MSTAPSCLDGTRLAHVIACGSDTSGSGKTTAAMHLLVALLYDGFSVASIDLDTRQRDLTRCMESRIAWNRRFGTCLPVPEHFRLESRDGEARQNDVEIRRFQNILEQAESAHDFIVIDTPGRDGLAMRMAHCVADTLVTPLNDTDSDLGSLARIDPVTLESGEISQYGAMVREARRNRRAIDNGLLDWVVVRNRMGGTEHERCRRLAESLADLAARLGYRLVDGPSDQPLLRELFATGLTALDPLDEEMTGSRSDLSHLSARLEIRTLVSALRLPVDETARSRAEARRAWLCNAEMPAGNNKQFRQILRRPAKYRFSDTPDLGRVDQILEAELAVAVNSRDTDICM